MLRLSWYDVLAYVALILASGIFALASEWEWLLITALLGWAYYTVVKWDKEV